jgi:hypothetical protein
MHSIKSTITRRVALIRLRLCQPDSPSVQRLLACVLVCGTLTPYQFLMLACVDPDVLERRMRWAVTAGLLCPAPELASKRARRTDPRETPYMLTEKGVRKAITMHRHTGGLVSI